ncbi:MAG: hypothetical protein U0931_16835 [Vulcanimicrobiota bacterium]
MQAGFWLAQHHPAVTPGPLAPACARCHAGAQLLASFCSRCGQDLRDLEQLPLNPGLIESWNQALNCSQPGAPEPGRGQQADQFGPQAPEPIDCLLGQRSLLVAVRQSGSVDLWNPHQGSCLGRLQLAWAAQAAALVDNLLVSVREQAVEVVHLTPALRQDICRFDRNARFQTPGPLASRLAADRRNLAWLAGDQLVNYSVRPQGLQPAWQVKLRGGCADLAWNPQGLWCLQERALFLLGPGGERLAEIELPAPALGLQAQAEDLWVCGQQGELWRCREGRIQRGWPAQEESCFAFAAGPEHVVQCCGRNLRALNLQSGRQHTLQVPQPCVLPPLVGPGWAVLVSYEGMLYHLALDQEQPRVLQARRPFSSFEPIVLPPVLAGDKLVLAGPEGQLAAWTL